MWRTLQVVRSKPKSHNPGHPGQLAQQLRFKQAVNFVDKYLLSPQGKEDWRRYALYNCPGKDYRNTAISASYAAAQIGANANMYSDWFLSTPTEIVFHSRRATDGLQINATRQPIVRVSTMVDRNFIDYPMQERTSGTMAFDFSSLNQPSLFMYVCDTVPRTGIIHLQGKPVS
jgi:hypothetical protein